MGGTILKTIKIDCYDRNFKDTEMSLFKMEFPVIKDLCQDYEIHVIDTGKVYKYKLAEDFSHMYIVTD